jgi:hypothetical protein
MATNKELYPLLATEEELNNDTATIVYYRGKPGYLMAYDAGLGFFFGYKDSSATKPELSADEISLTPNMSGVDDIEPGTPIVAKWGHNTVTNKPFEFLYEFGYYTQMGCVVYNRGECNMQDAHAFQLDQIRVASPEDLEEFFWGN